MTKAVGRAAKKEPILCYIDGNWAYFTTQSLQKQWGDDWDDKPFDCNAGPPYGPCWHNEPQARNDPNAHRGWKPGTETPLAAGEFCWCPSCKRDWTMNGNPKWEIIKVAWDGDFDDPSSMTKGNWSVKDINSKCVPWLRNEYGDKKVLIWAGTKLSEFKRMIREAGGSVYVEET